MQSNNVPRIMLVGTGSGCGKTTVTCALLKALVDRKVNIASFKCGPDYIDPMFHSQIIGTKSRNLDLYLCGENVVKYLLAENCLGNNGSYADIAVIEGAMGMYDGQGFETDEFSANHTARITNTGEILVVDVKGKGISIVAEISGYLNFSENNLKGVILNNCSKAMYPIYSKAIEDNLNIKTYGFMPKVKEAEIGSRHLGLITAEEIEDICEKVQALGKIASNSLDIEGILQLSKETVKFEYDETYIDSIIKSDNQKAVRIGIARDKAFCFYYEDNFDLLEKLGAELVYFSPLEDDKIPDNIDGLIFGGGYPEEHIEKLAANKSMLNSIKEAALKGIHIYAECGGFMYLGQSVTINGRTYETVGAINGNSQLTDKLVRFGYKTLQANKDNFMCKKNEQIRCHEFHYSDTDNRGDCFTAKKKNGMEWQTIVAEKNIFAGYPHLHFWSNPAFAKNFVNACRGGSMWK